MCRLVAYSGPAISLSSLVLDPPHSLVQQAFEPRLQKFGKVNVDGFGAGWFVPEVRPEPAVYRSLLPIWADRSFASIAPTITASTIVAAVRSATPPNPTDYSGLSPFARGPWLFTHNGFIDGFRDGRNVQLRRSLSEAREAEIEGATDSETLFALILDRIDRGLDPAGAVAEVISGLRPGNAGGLNVVLTDGRRVIATAVHNSLFLLRRDGAANQSAFVLASEPFDDDPGWRPVTDGSLLDLDRGSLTLRPL